MKTTFVKDLVLGSSEINRMRSEIKLVVSTLVSAMTRQMFNKKYEPLEVFSTTRTDRLKDFFYWRVQLSRDDSGRVHIKGFGVTESLTFGEKEMLQTLPEKEGIELFSSTGVNAFSVRLPDVEIIHEELDTLMAWAFDTLGEEFRERIHPLIHAARYRPE